MQARLVPQGLHPGRSCSLAPGARQVLSSTRASLLLLMFLLQGQAVRDGISCFRCPLCRDRDAFSSEMLSMGIRIPFRLVSCPAHQTGGWECCAMPGTAPAILALRCPVSLGFSFTKLEGGWGGKSGGALHLPYCQGSRDTAIFLSPSDCHRRTPTHMTTSASGTAAAMPVSACVQEAGSRQRHRGKLPMRHPGLCTGSLSRQELQAEGLRTRAVLDNPVLWSSQP